MAVTLMAVSTAGTSAIVRHIHEKRLSAAREDLRLAEFMEEKYLGMSSDWPWNWRQIEARAKVARERLDKLEAR